MVNLIVTIVIAIVVVETFHWFRNRSTQKWTYKHKENNIDVFIECGTYEGLVKAKKAVMKNVDKLKEDKTI